MKILQVKYDKYTMPSWVQFIPIPFEPKERMMVHKDQSNVKEGYVRVKHGNGFKEVSIFSLNHFTIIK